MDLRASSDEETQGKRMVASIKVTGSTTTIGTANTTLSNAKAMRLRNTDSVDCVVTVSDTVANVVLGTVQLAPSEIIYVEKKAAEVISSNNATSKTLANPCAKSGT